MTPPPGPADLKLSGSPTMSAIQSSTCVSSSVQAGLVAQSIPCTPSPADKSSPRIDGPEVLAGKYAKKLGDCQWVMPGKIRRSMSSKIDLKGSPCSGALDGRRFLSSPGLDLERTGKVSIRFW